MGPIVHATRQAFLRVRLASAHSRTGRRFGQICRCLLAGQPIEWAEEGDRMEQIRDRSRSGESLVSTLAVAAFVNMVGTLALGPFLSLKMGHFTGHAHP